MTERTQNDTKTIERIYVTYTRDVYQLAYRSTRNHADAEDVVQEVFMRVLQKWRYFRGDSHVKTWILRIAQNYIVDLARKRNLMERSWSTEVYQTPDVSMVSSVIEIDDMLHSLSDRHRAVIVLRIMNDLSVADTAKALGCSEGMVRVDTHRAVRRLKRTLQEVDSM
ncbi:RNA polymerase sigma factor [Alicyclobacillus dauci]|uniref:RNA polymerase sigma factor n=1 Tax=Alicyclobacillus dauci TaxID=1475485 RepID=A0ABY6YXW1_9BACL|nr:RNA polymerase sigma factor [Alicyclobacillus dauci]WAH35457.1 RNA polymerase sigma factor [Alicyclobacillus dauci]